MITQCTSCKAKFKARDELRGREAKCPKCGKMFCVEGLSGDSKPSTKEQAPVSRSSDVCSGCGLIMDQSEKACVFRGKVVCSECDARLREAQETKHAKLDEGRPSCFFCKENASEDDSACLVNMFKTVKARGKLLGFIKSMGGGLPALVLPDATVAYSKKIWKVPRCRECKDSHDRREKLFRPIVFGGAICGAVVGIFFGIYVLFFVHSDQEFQLWQPFVGIPMCMLLVGMLGVMLGVFTAISIIDYSSSKRKGYSHHLQFPEIKEAIRSNWVAGNGPQEKYGTEYVEVPLETLESPENSQK